MATCKECIHNDFCNVDGYIDADDCTFFKNKADFVEVVRCEECRHKDDCAGQMVHTTRDYILEQNISTYNKVEFCSYGEPKNDKE